MSDSDDIESWTIPERLELALAIVCMVGGFSFLVSFTILGIAQLAGLTP